MATQTRGGISTRPIPRPLNTLILQVSPGMVISSVTVVGGKAAPVGATWVAWHNGYLNDDDVSEHISPAVT